MFKIATWNVNSLKVRLGHVLDWLATNKPDVLALQETKLIDDHFPKEQLETAGYRVSFSGQKTYNGVATLCKTPFKLIATELPDYDDEQKRVLAVENSDTIILNLYVPNGAVVDSDKYLYKLKWLSKLQPFVAQLLKENHRLIILGDFNIAPKDEDVHDPAGWEGHVLVSESERVAYHKLLSCGLSDCFRLFSQPEKSFSWWDYRAGAFRRNHGLRIDHILASTAITKSCSACYIDTVPRALKRPSDHTPVVAEFAF